MMQLADDMMANDTLSSKSNDESTFRYVFEKHFKDIAASRYEQNEDFFVRMFNDEAFYGFHHQPAFYSRSTVR